MTTSDLRSDSPGAPRGPLRLRADMVWPVGLTLALLTVVLVNVAFIVIAVSGSDEVDAAYVAGER